MGGGVELLGSPFGKILQKATDHEGKSLFAMDTLLKQLRFNTETKVGQSHGGRCKSALRNFTIPRTGGESCPIQHSPG